MSWHVLMFVLYVGGEPYLQLQIHETLALCDQKRIEVSRQINIGKAICTAIYE